MSYMQRKMAEENPTKTARDTAYHQLSAAVVLWEDASEASHSRSEVETLRSPDQAPDHRGGNQKYVLTHRSAGFLGING